MHMSMNVWKDPGTSRLQFGLGSSGKIEYLFGGALALIIVAALGLTIYSFFVGPSAPPMPDDFHMFCINPKCPSPEVVLKRKDLKNEDMYYIMGPAGMMGGRGGPKCPNCGFQGSLILELHCPNPSCQKYFVTQEMKYRRPPAGSIICPYCKTDLLRFVPKES
jgi:hypothetical protein